MSKAPLRIIWLADVPVVASTPVARTESINPSTGEKYEHDVAVLTCKVERIATAAEVEEWRIRP